MRKTGFEGYAAFFFMWLATTTVADAQSSNKPLPEERAGKQTEKMKTELALTGQQYQQVANINLKYAQKNEVVAGSNEGTLRKINTFRSNRNQKDIEMKKILTTEQYAKYLIIQDELAAQMKKQYKN
jgi:Spy/CpxP family protein refolding chaperone